MRIKLFPSMLEAFSGLLIKTVEELPTTNPPTGSVFIYPRRAGGLIELAYRLPDGATGIISGSGSGGSERFQGAYDAETTYLKDETGFDTVEYEGSLWAYDADTPSSGNTPGTESAYWVLRVKKGDPGTPGVDGETWVAAYPVPRMYTPELGIFAPLDGTINQLRIDPEGVSRMERLEFDIRSVSMVTGDIVLKLGEQVAEDVWAWYLEYIIPVTADWVGHGIDIAGYIGGLPVSQLSDHILLRRDVDDPRDTLQDGGAVTAALRTMFWRRAAL